LTKIGAGFFQRRPQSAGQQGGVGPADRRAGQPVPGRDPGQLPVPAGVPRQPAGRPPRVRQAGHQVATGRPGQQFGQHHDQHHGHHRGQHSRAHHRQGDLVVIAPPD